VPPRTNNLTVYYERNGLNVRVARQYTASHVVNTSTGLNVPGGAYAYTTARAQVDLSVGMNLKQMFNFAYNTDVTLSVERQQGDQPDLHAVQQCGLRRVQAGR
jgi:preprotein translocase subunit SecB